MRLLPFLLFFLLFADDGLAAVGFDKVLCLLNRLRARELHLLARALSLHETTPAAISSSPRK